MLRVNIESIKIRPPKCCTNYYLLKCDITPLIENPVDVTSLWLQIITSVMVAPEPICVFFNLSHYDSQSHVTVISWCHCEITKPDFLDICNQSQNKTGLTDVTVTIKMSHFLYHLAIMTIIQIASRSQCVLFWWYFGHNAIKKALKIAIFLRYSMFSCKENGYKLVFLKKS